MLANILSRPVEQVLRIPNSQFVFVHQEHPTIHLLKTNQQTTGIEIDESTKMDGQWYKLTEPLFMSSCESIRTNILNNIATSDLTNMQVQLHRIGGVDWSHISATDTAMSFAPNPTWDSSTRAIHMAAHEKNFTDKPATFMARIQLEYEMQK